MSPTVREIAHSATFATGKHPDCTLGARRNGRVTFSELLLENTALSYYHRMKTSLANNPILPLAAGAGVLAIFLGSMQNADKKEENVDLSGSSSEIPATAADTVPEPASVGEPATDAVVDVVDKATLTVGKADTVGGLKITADKVTAKNVTVTVSKKSYVLTTGKAATIGEYTVTVTKVNPAKKRAAISVTGG